METRRNCLRNNSLQRPRRGSWEFYRPSKRSPAIYFRNMDFYRVLLFPIFSFSFPFPFPFPCIYFANNLVTCGNDAWGKVYIPDMEKLTMEKM